MDIIFDLDGTLWDSSETVLRAWNEVFEKNNLPIISKDDLEGVMGLDMSDILKQLQPSANENILDEMTEYEYRYLKKYKGKLYKNMINTIKNLSKEHRLFIVSNCDVGYIDLFLELNELKEYFTDYLCWGDTKTPKGETIKTLMDKNNIVKTCYVGDTLGDKNAADYAEIPFIYTRYGFGEVEEYNYYIDTIRDVENHIKNLEHIITPQELWGKFIDKNPKYKNVELPESYYFCDNKKDADNLAELVKIGVKTATSSLYCLYELEQEKLPKSDDLAIITDFEGNAVAIISNSKVEIIKFSEVTEELASREGEGDKSLQYWRKVHIDIFTKWLKEFNMDFDESMEIVYENFEVLFTGDELLWGFRK